ncbi:MAG: methionine--tRNA ligase [Eggerthellales bacterium]|nr:methionine--tRNA ligase [Eggerthellales bacterium]
MTDSATCGCGCSQPKDPFYITTPIYYVNGVPHIGTAYTTIAADAIARFNRLDGRDVHFLTGMDEHGQKVAQSAKEHGLTPQEWCDSQVPQFKDLWVDLNISNDDFIRTTEPRHMQGVAKFLQTLYDNGYLYKGGYEGFYCTPCETFFAEGDLKDGNCPDCGRSVEFIREENWFFKLSEFGDRLLAYYEANPDFIRPEIRRNEVLSFVKSGLQDLSVSRTTFDWGVPLPFDPEHVTYVWVDALINYITALGYGSEDESEFARRWPADFHFVGKDIIRFHCIIWPAMLMAAGLPLPKHVFAHGFLMAADGSKMSKSKGNALYPRDLMAQYGIDAYRYYFLSDVTFGADGNIGLDRITQVYNADLANSYGNLFSRVSNMTVKNFDGQVPQVPAELAEAPNPLREIVEAGLYERYAQCMSQVDFCGAAKAVMELVHRANLYVEETAPWNLAKSEETRGQLAAVLYNTLEACRICALLLAPFMPDTSDELYSRLGLGKATEVTDGRQAAAWGGLAAGNPVTKGEPLFPRLPNPEMNK